MYFNDIIEYIRVLFTILACVYIFNIKCNRIDIIYTLLFLGSVLILDQFYTLYISLPVSEIKVELPKAPLPKALVPKAPLPKAPVSILPKKPMNTVPEKNMHVGFIMDGNGRWAKAKGLSRIDGHTKGEEVVTDIILACSKHESIKYATFYAFSLQNWKRSKIEIDHILKTVLKSLKKMRKYFIENNIKCQCIGNKQHLPNDLLETINDIEKATEHATGLICSICISYGGREEILDTFKNIKGDLSTLTTNDISKLYPVPDLDLVIRTSGEYRISNFCLWQSAYTEYYFTKTLWPDFTVNEFQSAINEFQMRNRTMGEVKTEDSDIPSIEEKYSYLKTLFATYNTVINHVPLYNKLLKDGYCIDPSTEEPESKDRFMNGFVMCSEEAYKLSLLVDDHIDDLPMDLQIRYLKLLYTDYSLETIEQITKQSVSELYYTASSREKALLKKSYECAYLLRVSTDLNDKTIYRFLEFYYYICFTGFDGIYSNNGTLLHTILFSFIDDYCDKDVDAKELQYITEDTNRIISNVIQEIINSEIERTVDTEKGLSDISEHENKLVFSCISVLLNEYYKRVPIYKSGGAFAKYILN